MPFKWAQVMVLACVPHCVMLSLVCGSIVIYSSFSGQTTSSGWLVDLTVL
jgi:hypothetical protein